MTREQIIRILKKRQGKLTKKELAKQLGISAPYLGDVMLGKREPGPAILRALKLKRQTVYSQ
jgi:transcriptional regulator with XRE-family HTH domain